MAVRKLTFSVPEPLAAEFLRRIASRERSRFVCDALMAQLKARDAALIRSCEVANRIPDIAAIETEFDNLADGPAEPWA